MQLNPQDFLVALKVVAWGEQRGTYARLAQELGISVSAAHACIQRGLLALFDALRVCKARERGMALERLQALIDPASPRPVRGSMHGEPGIWAIVGVLAIE